MKADPFRLDGKVALVTGASSGLGVGIAEAYAGAGADLVICARRKDRLLATADLVRNRGRRCLVVPADVGDPEQGSAVVAKALEEFGRVDILVNNAGLASAVPATRESAEEFSRVVAVNLHGSYYMAQACGRVMKPGSSIVNLSSVLGITTAHLPQAAYTSSKAAVIGLTRDLAQQWTGRKGIRVNALAPGFFPSEMTDAYPEGYLEKERERVPIGRAGRVEELAAAAVFLASDAASYISGVVLPVDGGLLVN